MNLCDACVKDKVKKTEKEVKLFEEILILLVIVNIICGKLLTKLSWDKWYQAECV